MPIALARGMKLRSVESTDASPDTTLATIFPATMGPKADPLTTPEVIKPEWFFYVAFRWLKLFPGTFAILSTGFIVFVMFVWPFIDRWLREKTRFPEASVWVGIAAVFALAATDAFWLAFTIPNALRVLRRAEDVAAQMQRENEEQGQ